MRWMAVLSWRLPPRSSRWRLVLPELTGIGATPAARASLASVAKRPAPAISPSNLAAVSGPKPGSASNCGATSATRSAISASRSLAAAVSSRRRRSSSRAIRTRAVCSARARRRAIRVDPFFENRALVGSLSSGQRSCRCQSKSLLSATRLRDQSFSVIDQQPDVELDAGQLRRRQPVQAFAQRRPGDRERVDAVGLAALAAAAASFAHELGRHSDDALAADHEEPLKGARHVSAVLQRPNALLAERPELLVTGARRRPRECVAQVDEQRVVVQRVGVT